MSDGNSTLRNALVESYDYLHERLTRRFQSSDLAREALHDTYLKLGNGQNVQLIRNPTTYLIQIATNLARDKLRRGKRITTVAEIETAFHLVDETPGPAQAAEGRSELRAFERALADLPPRRRAILLISFNESLTSREIARRFGLSTRMIDIELKLAREHCARAMLNTSKK